MVAATAAHAAAAPTIPTPPALASFNSLAPISSVSHSLICAHPTCLVVPIPTQPCSSLLTRTCPHVTPIWPPHGLCLCLFDLPVPMLIRSFVVIPTCSVAPIPTRPCSSLPIRACPHLTPIWLPHGLCLCLFGLLVPISSVARSLVHGHPHPLSCTDCTFVHADCLCLLVLCLCLGSFGLWWGSLHALQPLIYVYIEYTVSKYIIIKQLTFKA